MGCTAWIISIGMISVEGSGAMTRDNSKGRGKYEDEIELKYIQLPHKIYELIFLKYGRMSETDRALALLHYVYHYYTNKGFATLEAKNSNAFMLCDIMNEATFVVQNQARWKCFDEFYKGRNDIDYEIAADNYKKEIKEKKKETNKKYYLKHKEVAAPDPEADKREGFEKLNQFAEEHGIDSKFEL